MKGKEENKRKGDLRGEERIGEERKGRKGKEKKRLRKGK